jgi:hypothetical protein
MDLSNQMQAMTAMFIMDDTKRTPAAMETVNQLAYSWLCAMGNLVQHQQGLLRPRGSIDISDSIAPESPNSGMTSPQSSPRRNSTDILPPTPSVVESTVSPPLEHKNIHKMMKNDVKQSPPSSPVDLTRKRV